jgi:hypothetical protein
LQGAFEAFALDRWGWRADGKQIKLATDVGVVAVEIPSCGDKARGQGPRKLTGLRGVF